MNNDNIVPSFRYVGPAAGLLPALKAAAAVTAARIALAGRLTPAQVAAHNAFIDAMRDEGSHKQVNEPSRFVGITRGLPFNTTC